MKKKKRIITTLGLLLVVVIGATFAYYTSNTSFENVFNAGKYKITLTEEFVSPDNWVPGETIPKTVTAKNDGTVDAAVRISYTEQWTKEIDGVETDITSQVSPNPAIINFDNTDDWTLSNGKYYYKYILKPTDETSSFISGVTLDPNLNSVTCTGEGNTKTCEARNEASGAKYKLTFTIETIQYDVYESEWNTDVEITEKTISEPVALIYSNKGDTQTKSLSSIEVGDYVTLGNDGFYVAAVSQSTTTGIPTYNQVLLLAENYLKNIADDGEPETWRQTDDGEYDAIAFSDEAYWEDCIGINSNPTGCTKIYRNLYPNEEYGFVYDSNSYLYTPMENYKDYLEGVIGTGIITKIRPMSYNEGNSLIDRGFEWIDDKQFWLGSYEGEPYEYHRIFLSIFGYIDGSDYLSSDYSADGNGILPLIEVPISAF